MKCEYCGSDLDLPFRCFFCGRYFCAEHRLPELHMCPNFKREVKTFLRIGEPSRHSSNQIFIRSTSGFRKRLYNVTSSLEITHISLATIIVALVGVSTAITTVRFLNPLLITLLVLIFVASFMLHEVGHKFSARYYGLWAEFRLSYLGVLVTLISIFTPFIKIVSPGSVLIYGWADKETIGKISLSGPLINIVLSICFLLLNFFNFGGFLLKIAYIWGFAINAYIALFNLIPLSILDGAKIFKWNKHVWGILFTIVLILTVIIYGHLY
ncbi:MAG: AN1-type zinc finger domain-containing protein [Candidatus Bathyarchaeia archaeon]